MLKRVMAPAVVVSSLWITGSSITTYYVHKVYEYHTRALDEDVSTIRAAWAMQDALWRLQAVVMETAGKASATPRVEIGALVSAFQRHLDEAERTSFTPEEKVLIKVVQQHFSAYRNQIEARRPPASPAAPDTAEDAEKETLIRLARAVAEPCRQIVELNERTLADSTLRSARLSTAVNLIRLAFLTTGPVVGVLCGLWVARGLHRSISQISVTLSDATGELNREVGLVEVQTPADLPGLHQQVQTIALHLRQVMEELQQARRQAMSAERLAAVGELAAGVAHELRNPLTSIKLLIQTAAQRQPQTALAGKQLQVVEQEVGRMENIIQGLLDFARPPKLRRVQYDLRTTVRRALNLIEGRAKHQYVTVVEQLPDRPAVVDGDPEQLHQILVNLFLNAIEAMPQGGSLTVALESNQENGNRCRVSVTDSGPGISPPVLDRIFEPFVTNKEHGTGLGLAVSHRIAKEHGGMLSAGNRAGGGAIFTLELPVSKPDEPRAVLHDGQPSATTPPFAPSA